jgi:hypothetical protein
MEDSCVRSRRSVHHRRYPTRAESPQDIFREIDVVQNWKRSHQALGCVGPEQFEQSLRMYTD